ncbi:MAG: class D sortase [Oscillospiraceae bacterium]|jgi:sortase A|nr:class D sortase [Oscillospiraceae bacterium]
MKKLIAFILTAALCAAFAMPAFAADYDFGSGPDTADTFGKPTGYDAEVTPNPMSTNTRRNKDAAYFPPPYGVFSGDIPTDPTSLYHDNTPQYAGYTGNPSADLDTSYNGGVSDVGVGGYGGMLPSTSTYETPVINTAPLYYEDGSIGSIHIPSAKKTITVYEGESLENMKKGIGHFESTSCWDGNVAFAGHNRGAAAYFSFVKNLALGDTITYTTKYGSRTYTVYNKVKISETDYSGLAWSEDNIISLITCVENEPAYRWLVQARENG